MAGTPLTDAIEALTTYSNTVTGASDTTLSEAVATLASGYGGGGSGWTTEGIANRTEPSGALTISFEVKERAFMNCKNITSIALTDGTTITGGNAFLNCTGITTITASGDYIDTFQASIFQGCTSLQTVNIGTKGRISGTNSFRDCTNLTEYRAPYYAMLANGTERAANDSQMATSMFYNDSSLVLADMGHAKGQFANCFNGCTALRTLILRRSVVCEINAWSASAMGGIYDNPTASTIYVPQALISSYQTASNWSSAYSAGVTFAKIEGSIYEL